MLFVVMPREAQQELKGLLQEDPLFFRPRGKKINEFWQRLSDFTEVDPWWLMREGIKTEELTMEVEDRFDRFCIEAVSRPWLELNIRFINGGKHIFHCWSEDEGKVKSNVSL